MTIKFISPPAALCCLMLSPASAQPGTEYRPGGFRRTLRRAVQIKFDELRCRYVGAARINDYNFVYDKKTGWQIESVYYGSDVEIARSAGRDR